MGKGGNLEAPCLGAALSRLKRPHGRPTQTAAGHCPPPIGPGELEGGDKWLALGETRRAATLCKTACGIGTIKPLPLAKGPGGTKGCRSHRTIRVEQPKPREGFIGRAWTRVWHTPISPATFALYLLSGFLLVLTVLVLFFKLAVTAAFLAWTIHQVPWLKRLGWYMLAAGLKSGGLVLFCWGFDLSFTLLGYTATMLLSLPEPQFRIIILGGAMVFLYVIVAPEGGGNTRVLHEDIAIFSSHKPRSAQSLAIHQEAGRLRRKVAATLFFKVFDPGGSLCYASSCFCLRFVLQSNTTRVCGLLVCATSLADICGLRCRAR